MEEKGRPVSWQEGEYTVTRTTARSAPGCHEGCGVLIYSKDGKVEKVEGDPEHPYNQGRLCPRCVSFPEVINHPDRLKYPMKRVGERGEGKWERITWDEAYDTIEKRFKEIFNVYGGKSIVGLFGTGRDLMWQPYRFIYSMGSPNTGGALSGQSCYIPRVIAGFSTYGAIYPILDGSAQFEDRYDNPEWKAPQVIIVWGCNVVDSNPDGYFGAWIVECMKRGAKLIVVDPRLTWLAARADVWLNLRPGTDGALALAMLNVIIAENLYDKDFVENWTMGFDQLAEHVKQYPPEEMAKVTWVTKEKIEAAARLYANARAGAIQLGLAVDMQVSGLSAAQAIMQLMCITGNLDVPGGQVFCPAPFGLTALAGAGWGLEEFVPEEVRAITAGHQKYPILKFFLPVPSGDEIIKQYETGEPYPLKIGWIQGSNLIAGSAQDSDRWLKVLKELEFNVALELFMTPTAQMLADIVLPIATFAEKDSIHSLYFNISTVNKAVDLYGDCRTDLQINLEVGKRINPEAWPWNNDLEVLNGLFEHSARQVGLPVAPTVKEIRENKGWKYPNWEYRKYEKGMMRPDGKPGFNTPSGKVEFFSLFFQNFGLPPMPEFSEPYHSPVSTPELFKEYPIILMTGARSKASFHSEHRQIKPLREYIPDPLVEINPEDAAELGIKTGDWVWIENEKDRIRQKAKVTPSIQQHMALSYHGWWYPEMKDPATNFGYREVNINRLLEMGHIGPSGFGADIKSTLVKIYKADSGPFDDVTSVEKPSKGAK